MRLNTSYKGLREVCLAPYDQAGCRLPTIVQQADFIYKHVHVSRTRLRCKWLTQSVQLARLHKQSVKSSRICRIALTCAGISVEGK